MSGLSDSPAAVAPELVAVSASATDVIDRTILELAALRSEVAHLRVKVAKQRIYLDCPHCGSRSVVAS